MSNRTGSWMAGAKLHAIELHGRGQYCVSTISFIRSPFEIRDDVIRQWRVEIIRDFQLPGESTKVTPYVLPLVQNSGDLQLALAITEEENVRWRREAPDPFENLRPERPDFAWRLGESHATSPNAVEQLRRDRGSCRIGHVVGDPLEVPLRRR